MIHKLVKSVNDSVSLVGHKARRLYHCSLNKKKTMKFVENHRRGECNRCGKCCKILFHCPFYIEDIGDGKPGCAVYEERPATCSMFPIHPMDLTNVPEGCGYSFEGHEEK